MRYTINILQSELNDDSCVGEYGSIESDNLKHAIILANSSTRLVDVDREIIQYAVVVDTENDNEIVYSSK